MLKKGDDEKKRKWNTHNANRKNRTLKPLTPKSGEDQKEIPNQIIIEIINQENRSTNNNGKK